MTSSTDRIIIELGNRREEFGSIQELESACRTLWKDVAQWHHVSGNLSRGDLRQIEEKSLWLEALASAGEQHLAKLIRKHDEAADELKKLLRHDPFADPE